MGHGGCGFAANCDRKDACEEVPFFRGPAEEQQQASSQAAVPPDGSSNSAPRSGKGSRAQRVSLGLPREQGSGEVTLPRAQDAGIGCGQGQTQ